MEKCLVTRLEGSVTDDSLLKLNEWRFKLVDNIIINPLSVVLSEVGKLNFFINKKVTLTLTGTAVFLDSNNQNNVLGQSLNVEPPAYGRAVSLGIRYGNGDSELSISDKTAFKKLGYYSNVSSNNRAAYNFHAGWDNFSPFTKKMFVCKTEDFKYVALSDIVLGAVDVSGDIEDINITELQVLSIRNLLVSVSASMQYRTNLLSKLYGDGSSLLKRPLKLLDISWSKITGDIKDLNTTVLASLQLEGSKIYGDISTITFPVVTGMLTLHYRVDKGAYASIGHNLYGDVCKSLEQSVETTGFGADGQDNFSGNIGQISPNICLFSNRNGDSQFSYSKIADRQYILAMNVVKISNIDEFLNYMSTLSFNSRFESYPQYKVISLRGTRTSASDSAIATLQSKGITVTINNI